MPEDKNKHNMKSIDEKKNLPHVVWGRFFDRIIV